MLIFLNNLILLDLTLDGLPPTVNHIYKSHGKLRYKSHEAKLYQKLVCDSMRNAWNNKEPFNRHLELYITFQTNDHVRWDIDNRVKALQDCLNIAGVIKDDSLINLLHVERTYGNSKSTNIILKESQHELRRTMPLRFLS